jgi:TatD DNase family protein
MLIDTHCHLDFADFDAERDESDCACPCFRRQADGDDFDPGPQTRCAAGADRALPERVLFCWHASQQRGDELDVTADELVHLAERNAKVVAIGEAGLDYFYDTQKPEDQKTGLRRHIEAARRTQLPLVIHSRSADEDMAEILTEETGKGAFPFILHCFSSGQALADTGVSLGGYVSFSGILTFPKSTELRDIAKTVPWTGCWWKPTRPYLAPKRWRGKRNEPSYVVNTAEVLAEVKGVSYEEMADITTANAFRCFKKMPAL